MSLCELNGKLDLKNHGENAIKETAYYPMANIKTLHARPRLLKKLGSY